MKHTLLYLFLEAKQRKKIKIVETWRKFIALKDDPVILCKLTFNPDLSIFILFFSRCSENKKQLKRSQIG
jgi:hypothetical protein